jgi:CMP-N,N'-diacetyllegionaminic acid synthase
MRVSAIIIARGGSKGLPNKNILDFCGHPLLSWTIRQAQAARHVSDIWISSDSMEILEIGEKYGAIPILRPSEISGDSASSESAWLHAMDVIESEGSGSAPIDYVLAPQVTSPLREPTDFSNAIDLIVKEQSDSLLSVVEVEDFFVWARNTTGDIESINYNYLDRKPRQQIEKRYLENGSFYLFKPSLLRKKKNRLGGRISIYVMERFKMFQIDARDDIELCSIMMSGYGLDRT